MRQDKATRAISTGPALVLLLVTAGLLTMHTLGQCGGHDASMHAHVWPIAPPAAHGQAAVMAPDGQSQTHIGSQGPQGPVPFGLLAVCVAVLAALVALIVISLLGDRTAGFMRLDRLTQRAADMVRGPPVVPIGLLLADLSVARH